MIDHFNLPVADLERSKAFYDKVLAAIGYHTFGKDGNAVGYGETTWAFGIVTTLGIIPCLHVAFTATSQRQVDEFHRVALELGARSNGTPGSRVQYDPNYYAAFVRDPDGHNVEAVFRG